MKKVVEWVIKEERGQGLMVYGIGIFIVTLSLVIAIGLINGDLYRIYATLTTPRP